MRGQLKSVLRKVRNRFVPGGLILMYHRITDTLPDPWRCCVSPQHFAEQLELIRREFHPVPFSRFPAIRGSEKFSPTGRRPIAVTFDDGYADNLHTALPLLQRYEIPATVFITTENISRQGEFWSDEMERILLQPGRLPQHLQLSIAGRPFEWDLKQHAEYSETACRANLHWNALSSVNPTQRHSLFRELYPLLQPLTDPMRDEFLHQLRELAGIKSERRETHRFITTKELQQLAQNELIEIGAHSVTHSPLSSLTETEQRKEIRDSKQMLENTLARPIRNFAYPYGDYNQLSVELVRQAGFERACTTYSTAVRKSSDCFELPRVQVQDWKTKEFRWWLSRWLYG